MRCLSLLLMTLSTTSLIACGESPPPDVKLGAPVDEDGDGYPDEHDCDDGDAAINPSADERCDGIDNDCDGEIDEHAVDRETFWADRDGDGFGDAARATEACSAPGGFVENADDCDDTDPSVSPDGAEVCNDVDDDCDGLVDADDDSIDPSGLYTVWPDLDGDHKGDRTAAAFQSCRDRGGVSLVGDDCDDSDPSSPRPLACRTSTTTAGGPPHPRPPPPPPGPTATTPTRWSALTGTRSVATASTTTATATSTKAAADRYQS
jgi:hypothetical protein